MRTTATEPGRVLTPEEDALRHVAMLVARGAPTREIFEAVAEQVGRILGRPWVGVMRYDSAGSFVVLATWGEHPFKVGSRWPLDGPSIFEVVLRTGRPAAVSDYTRLSGTVAQAALKAGIVGAVGAPIVVDGATWGVIAVPTTRAAPIPDGAETRLVVFAELVATAISNAEARNALARLVDEQAALRRVATLVARESSPVEVFVAVTEEANRVLEGEAVGLLRFESDGTATLLAQSETPWEPPPLGTRFALDGENVITQVFRTGRAARADDWTGASGAVAAMASVLGVRSAVATPVVVEGHLWGTIIAATSQTEPLAAEMESRIAQFTELVATAIANAEARGELSRLAEEQAALRRIAVLVAQQPSPEDVFTAVTEAVGQILGADLAAMHVFRGDGAATVAASWSQRDPALPIGTRLPLDGDSTLARIFQTASAARIDGYADAEGETAEVARGLRLRSAVGAPIVVQGKLWGALIAATRGDEPLPEDAETRIAAFTELVATAVSNAQAREDLQRLADEQAALRRVATLVAEDAPPRELFRAATVEVGTLLDADFSGMARFEDGDVVPVAVWAAQGEHPPVPERWPLRPGDPATTVVETRRAVRWDDWAALSVPIAAFIREQLAVRSSVTTPIFVEGRLWGVLAVHSRLLLPQDSESRSQQFSDLVATAIANAEARANVARLADEQAALRRVATLVAVEASRGDVFNAIVEGVGGILGEELRLVRFDGEHALVVAGSDGPHDNVFPVGTRVPLGGENALSRVFRTGEPARIDDYSQASGPIAEAVRPRGLRGVVATPIIVEGRPWGAMLVAAYGAGPVPPDTERRLGQFSELMATAIANAEARDEIERLAEEQAALRRVATLVAEGVPAHELFALVTQEVARIVEASRVLLIRYEPERMVSVVASVGDDDFPVGSRWPLDGPSAAARAFETGRAARVDDYRGLPGAIAAQNRKAGVTSTLAVPITVDARAWGAVRVATTEPEPLPAGMDARLSNFTGLVATAISNASSRSELVASRARIVSAGDEARRRIERNLHDGTQQRLIALGLDLQQARTAIPEAERDTHSALERVERDLEAILVELRELSHGLHPPLLSRLGLGPSLQALARRSPIPVQLDIDLAERPAASLETAVYYVVSEAVTNAIKHSHASEITVTITISGDRKLGNLHATIVDDGLGGADPGGGSGLTGLLDRVDALGGRFALDSPPRGGTTISVEFPVEPTVAS